MGGRPPRVHRLCSSAAIATQGGYEHYGIALKNSGMWSTAGTSREVWIGRIVGSGIPRSYVIPVPEGFGTEILPEWQSDGVRLNFPASGAYIHVPAKVFIDTR
jgi:hypothetical protein